MKLTRSDIAAMLIGAIVGVAMAVAIISCAPLEDLKQVAVVAEKIEPVVDIVKDIATADGPRDWWDIASKVLAGVGVIAAGTGGEMYRRKRKAAKEAL